MNKIFDTSKRYYVLESILFLIVFGVYLHTINPSIYTYDTPEFIAFSFSLEQSHPTGHPLFIILGKFFTLIPLGNIAFKVNTASAFFGAITIVLVYKIIFIVISNIFLPALEYPSRDVLLKRVIAFIAALTLSATYSFWIQAIRAEVYTLNAFLTSLIIYLLISENSSYFSNDSKKFKVYLLLSFLIGLGFANTPLLIVLLLPGITFLILWRDIKGVFDLKNISLMAFFFLLGGSVYLFLPIRSAQKLFEDWGNPENFKNFIYFITGKQYTYASELKFIHPIVGNILPHFKLFYGQLYLAALTISLLGIFLFLKRDIILVCFFTLIAVFNINSTMGQDKFMPLNPDSHGWLFATFLILIIFFAVGMYGIARMILLLSKRLKIKKGGENIIVFAAVIILLTTPLSIGLSDYSIKNKNNYYYATEFLKQVISSLEGDKVFILTIGDGIDFPLIYFQDVENLYHNTIYIERSMFRDLRFVRKLQMDEKRLVIPSMEEIIKWRDELAIDIDKQGISWRYPPFVNKLIQEVALRNLSRYPIYWETKDDGVFSYKYFVPSGALWKFKGEEINELTEDMLKGHNMFWEKYNSMTDADKGIYFDYPMRSHIALIHFDIGNLFNSRELMNYAIYEYELATHFLPESEAIHLNFGNVYLSINKLDLAREEYIKALDINPEDKLAYNNLGIYYKKIGDIDSAKKNYLRALEIDPNFELARHNLKTMEKGTDTDNEKSRDKK